MEAVETEIEESRLHVACGHGLYFYNSHTFLSQRCYFQGICNILQFCLNRLASFSVVVRYFLLLPFAASSVTWTPPALESSHASETYSENTIWSTLRKRIAHRDDEKETTKSERHWLRRNWQKAGESSSIDSKKNTDTGSGDTTRPSLSNSYSMW